MANQPAAIAQALADHDRTKRSTDIPLFYGQPCKDTIAARLLIVCINDAATIATWNEARKLLEFKMCLRDKAVGWFEGLAKDGVDINAWDTVKAEFLETYELKYLAKTTCANFTDLNQKPDISINDYTYRVQMAYKHLTDTKPGTMGTVRGTIAAGATEAEVKAEGINDAFKFIKHQLFLAGLKDGIRFWRPLKSPSMKASKSLASSKQSKMTTKGSTKLTPSEMRWKKKRRKKFRGTVCLMTSSLSSLRFALAETDTTMATTPTTTVTTKVTTVLRNSVTPTLNAGTARKKDTCKKIASPENATRLQWSMPMASPTSKTTASTTSLTSQLLLKLPQPPDTKTPLSGQSLTSAPITILTGKQL
jgi:hypothetical protein